MMRFQQTRWQAARALLTVLAWWAGLASFALAQAAVKQFDTAPVAPADDSAIRLVTQVVSLTVTVTDKHGRRLPALEKDAFTVFEDRVAQEIGYFKQVDAPASIAVVFDLSASMRGEKIARAHQALRRFLLNSHPEDEYSLIGFNDRAWVALDKTRNGQDLLQQLSTAEPQRGTALFDAVALGLKQLEHGLYARRALLIISDGEDNRSHVSFRQLKHLAQESSALIYAVGITESMAKPDLNGRMLEDLAEQTGGRAVFSLDAEEMCAVFEAIALELRQQYSLGYTPSNFVADGKWRKLKVKVAPPLKTAGLIVRTRGGYYAHPSQAMPDNEVENW
ncbi:MAG: VWA domain-containing protein [Deltaproteobacteria bacterium]|nr:VWA domain-containing protein [Deltaproteobacteria bacterium]